jgi:NAD(P)-dependent dehydrogenase (short-subunit alcohol dehydrogenase family)
MKRLDGKIALVTGGTSGIGLASAKLFAAEGAHVVITGRRVEKLDEAVAEIGSNVTPVQGDVGNHDDLDRLFARIGKEYGRLDIVFANAGAAEFAPFGNVDEGMFDRLFDGNVKGLFFSVQKALPLMPDGSAIVLTSSVVGSRGLPANSVYAATKAAIRSFARTWATDLKARGIRVNAVSPGPVDTTGLRDLLASVPDGEKRREGFAQTVPLGRLATPDEIAQAVLFLASSESSYVTGTELFVDGGMGQV